LRRAALWLFLASLIVAVPLGGRAAADPAPVEQSASASPSSRKISSLLRFIEEPPHIRLQATPPVAIKESGNFERFAANVALFRLFNAHRAPWLDALALVLLVLGSGWGIIPAVAYAAFFRRSILPVLLISLLVETALVTFLKQFCAQPRPGAFLENIYIAEELLRRSFPSGDAAMAFTIVWSLKRDLPWPARAGLILLAVLIAGERVYLGAHFPLDVTAGALAGILSVLIAERLFSKRKPVEIPEDNVPAVVD